MSTTFTEFVVEVATLEWFAGLGYVVIDGRSIAPGELAAERANFQETVLEESFHFARHELPRLSFFSAPSVVNP